MAHNEEFEKPKLSVWIVGDKKNCELVDVEFMYVAKWTKNKK